MVDLTFAHKNYNVFFMEKYSSINNLICILISKHLL